MAKSFSKTNMLADAATHYCPGCTHGIIHRLVAEVLEELGVMDHAIAVASVGCSVLSYEYFNCDGIESAHGRAPAVATGVKRMHPDKVVFTYQGDGDLASIGMAETVHVAARNENITIIFVNNAIYGMTGGQMAPTSLPGMITTTTQDGLTSLNESGPIKVSEMLSQLDGPAHLSRVSVHDIKHMIKAKNAIKEAFKCQIEGRGFSMVEVLSTCPVNWNKTAEESLHWLRDNMIPTFPLGTFKGGAS